MRKDRIRKLADVVEKCEMRNNCSASDSNENYFNMAITHFDCGAPACIAGWAEHLFGSEDYPSMDSLAKDLLGLDRAKSQVLFAPSQPGAYFLAGSDSDSYITAKHAAAVLRNLADTGRVDWNVRF